jgi:hypothetical protein
VSGTQQARSLLHLSRAGMHRGQSGQGVSDEPAIADAHVSKERLSEEDSSPLEITLLQQS